MTPERLQQIEALFHAALELDGEERAAFLNRACGGDESLRREVESLLAYKEKTGSLAGVFPLNEAWRLLADDGDESVLGQTIDHYRILALLGAGGMGKVYLAEDQRLGRKVALKLLPAAFTADPNQVRLFHREARAASALNHPNLITVYDIGQADSLHFIAQEFIQGETLRQRLRGQRMALRSR